MKAALQKSPISADRVFEAKMLKEPHFDPNWHFHPEYQLFVVLRGTGTRFTGDHLAPFRQGDFVLTGPNLPHMWQSDPEYFEGNKDLWTEGIVVYLPEDFLGNGFLEKKEAWQMRQLLTRSSQGIEFYGNTNQQATLLMQQILLQHDFGRILSLLQLLHLLSQSTECRQLASAGYTNQLKASDTERMNSVHAFVMKNFREKITLDEVAAIANMTPTSFSRYFKTHANKNFSDFLTEIRIGYACKLLMDENIDVAQVCYDSGFYTLSNFNRAFREITGYNPLAYRKKYMGAG
ncbi:AraC family transcriptional regulator [Chitinophaga lutea]|uniref:AraC family transcriptional regulator n=1 Tax=Chitinophaga lutea TaxID=2488634 RepID=A0A3N4PW28_9BACT|nr:AraC family transcriptional regulator [Chitinophaga lutea]RPE12186.1 AraC family transcriptional regulator [Chitinophaga lutea]